MGPTQRAVFEAQGPGCGGPGEYVEIFLGQGGAGSTGIGGKHLELGCHRGVLHIAIAAGLVQFVTAEAGAGSGRIGLYGVALVEQALVVKLLQQPPEGLYVLVVIGDIGVLHIHPVAHLV